MAWSYHVAIIPKGPQSRIMFSIKAKAYYQQGNPSLAALGPFPVNKVTDAVRGHLVQKMGVPVTLYDGRRYAVLAPANKELRIVCAACFTPEMSLFEEGKCRKVSSFCQHFGTNARFRCKAEGWDSLDNVERRNELEGITDASFEPTTDDGVNVPDCLECFQRLGFRACTCVLDTLAGSECSTKTAACDPPSVGDPTNFDSAAELRPSEYTTMLSNVPINELMAEIRRRGEEQAVTHYISDDDFAQMAKDRGIKLLIDARSDDLILEHRRVTHPLRPTVETYYYAEKEAGKPHCSDSIHVDIDEDETPDPPGSKPKRRRVSYNTRSKDGAKRYSTRGLLVTSR